MQVTVWFALQLLVVKIRLEGETVPSDSSELLIPMVTSDVGRLFSFTVKVAVPPSSEVAPLIDPIVKPAESLSVFTSLE